MYKKSDKMATIDKKDNIYPNHFKSKSAEIQNIKNILMRHLAATF